MVIATDAMQIEEKAGIGIFCPELEWSFSYRLYDFNSVFTARFKAMILALQKLTSLITVVAIITDSLSVCSSLSAYGETPLLKVFRILIPAHFQCLHLVWVPGHKG